MCGVEKITKGKSISADKHFLYYIFKEDKDKHMMSVADSESIRFRLKSETGHRMDSKVGRKEHGKG